MLGTDIFSIEQIELLLEYEEDKELLSELSLDLLNTIRELKRNDLILGPANDGGYWLIGLSEKIIDKHLSLPFINIDWGKENVLQNTIDNFASKKLRHKLLDKKIDIDTIIDIENRK